MIVVAQTLQGSFLHEFPNKKAAASLAVKLTMEKK